MDSYATELNQLSRFLFDKAAALWQWSLALGFVSGAIGVAVSILAPSLSTNVVWAGAATVLLIVSYVLRFRFEGIHDAAETMRRQSVLSEGLGWEISRSQFNDWRRLAGGKVLRAATITPRPADYYETRGAAGPKRLAEMTFESAFWTKNLYRQILYYLVGAISAAALLLVGLLYVLPLFDLGTAQRLFVIDFIYLVIPVLISVDLVGIALKLRRGISTLQHIEPGLERLASEDAPEVGQVLRLVAEYNCVLAAGLPIPKWVFDRHHAEIEACWK